MDIPSSGTGGTAKFCMGYTSIASLQTRTTSQNLEHAIFYMGGVADHVTHNNISMSLGSILREFYQPANKLGLDKEQLKEQMKVWTEHCDKKLKKSLRRDWEINKRF